MAEALGPAMPMTHAPPDRRLLCTKTLLIGRFATATEELSSAMPLEVHMTPISLAKRMRPFARANVMVLQAQTNQARVQRPHYAYSSCWFRIFFFLNFLSLHGFPRLCKLTHNICLLFL